MLIGVPRETAAGETRVAATPETVKKLKAQGHTSASSRAPASPPAPPTRPTRPPAPRSPTAPARSAPTWSSRCARRAPTSCALMKRGAALVGMLNPFDRAGLEALAAAGLTSFALEAAPRTTRAQSMDVLSSQANIAGYKAVMIAADSTSASSRC